MSEENVERVRTGFGQYQAGMERGDPGAAFDSGFLAPDMEWFPLRGFPGASVYRGRDEFAGFMRAWTEDFEDWTIRLDRLVDAPGGQVVAFIHQTGTGKGSGVPVEFDLASIFKLEDGVVVQIRNYLDQTEALEAAGLSH